MSPSSCADWLRGGADIAGESGSGGGVDHRLPYASAEIREVFLRNQSDRDALWIDLLRKAIPETGAAEARLLVAAAVSFIEDVARTWHLTQRTGVAEEMTAIAMSILTSQAAGDWAGHYSAATTCRRRPQLCGAVDHGGVLGQQERHHSRHSSGPAIRPCSLADHPGGTAFSECLVEHRHRRLLHGRIDEGSSNALERMLAERNSAAVMRLRWTMPPWTFRGRYPPRPPVHRATTC